MSQQALAEQLTQLEGTMEFTVELRNLQRSTPDDSLINVESADNNAILQLYGDDDDILYEYMHFDNGHATVSLDLNELRDTEKLKVFLVWSPTSVMMHAGPFPPAEADELTTVKADIE